VKFKFVTSVLVFLLTFNFTTTIYSTGYSPLAGKVIVIDPGHGGIYPGAVINGVREADITLAVARKLRYRLIRSGAMVILTRVSDTNVAGPRTSRTTDLQARVNIARFSQANIFVSLHANSTPDSRTAGAISFFPVGRSSHLAQVIQQSLIWETHATNGGVRPADFYVLKNNPVPSALIEIGFLTNPIESSHLTNALYQNQLADGIYSGIYCYFLGRYPHLL